MSFRTNLEVIMSAIAAGNRVRLPDGRSYLIAQDNSGNPRLAVIVPDYDPETREVISRTTSADLMTVDRLIQLAEEMTAEEIAKVDQQVDFSPQHQVLRSAVREKLYSNIPA